MTIFAKGPAVETLLQANVEECLEFKSLSPFNWFEFVVPKPMYFSVLCYPLSINENSNRGHHGLWNRIPTTTATRTFQSVRIHHHRQTPTRILTTQRDTHRDDGDEVVVRLLYECHENQGRPLAQPLNKTVANG
jgi:hypothetical protein